MSYALDSVSVNSTNSCLSYHFSHKRIHSFSNSDGHITVHVRLQWDEKYGAGFIKWDNGALQGPLGCFNDFDRFRFELLSKTHS